MIFSQENTERLSPQKQIHKIKIADKEGAWIERTEYKNK